MPNLCIVLKKVLDGVEGMTICRTRLSLDKILRSSPDELDCSLLTEGRTLGMMLPLSQNYTALDLFFHETMYEESQMLA